MKFGNKKLKNRNTEKSKKCQATFKSWKIEKLKNLALKTLKVEYRKSEEIKTTKIRKIKNLKKSKIEKI